jgi:hypothetical protein
MGEILFTFFSKYADHYMEFYKFNSQLHNGWMEVLCDKCYPNRMKIVENRAEPPLLPFALIFKKLVIAEWLIGSNFSRNRETNMHITIALLTKVWPPLRRLLHHSC